VRRLVERVWYGNGAAAAAARAVLAPAEGLFRAGSAIRDVLYDAGALHSAASVIPVVSIGNLTVGGTGKTPVAAWVAGELARRGARPAIVLRGYGDDEPDVHRTLNPDVPVFVGADRAAAIGQAAGAGAGVAVLDDAFQHRSTQRSVDVVLVSADRWTRNVRLLPAGPWRAPLSAARRATLIGITRKAAANAVVEQVEARLSAVVPGVPRAVIQLSAGELIGVVAGSPRRALSDLAGSRVHAVLSIGDPGAFIRQLEGLGARVRASIFPDHHAFSRGEVERAAAAVADGELAVCTLKDAVKLAPQWPRLAPPLWYVSQQVKIERGGAEFDGLMDALVRACSGVSPNAG
jgi:tetraacyldisaccharide 4'-kinase